MQRSSQQVASQKKPASSQLANSQTSKQPAKRSQFATSKQPREPGTSLGILNRCRLHHHCGLHHLCVFFFWSQLLLPAHRRHRHRHFSASSSACASDVFPRVSRSFWTTLGQSWQTLGSWLVVPPAAAAFAAAVDSSKAKQPKYQFGK